MKVPRMDIEPLGYGESQQDLAEDDLTPSRGPEQPFSNTDRGKYVIFLLKSQKKAFHIIKLNCLL